MTDFPKHLKNFVVDGDESAPVALWKTARSLGGASCVLENGVFAGVLTQFDFPIYHPTRAGLKAGDLCNRNCQALLEGPHIFQRAREIFSRLPSIKMLPVLNQKRRLVNVVFKFQAFYEDYFRDPTAFHSLKPHLADDQSFPYMYYAHCLWRAAAEARRNNYPAFSALEFGVASGNGLICCEWHARAIAEIFDLTIEVYGFDTGQGLPPPADHRDLPHVFGQSHYQMESLEILQERLTGAALVIGDIQDTAPAFFAQYKAAPVGAMLIDVDIYRSTMAALSLLNQAEDHFLPRVQMYFDDIGFGQDCLGESLAIKDFNAQNENIKISPEFTFIPPTEAVSRNYTSFLHRLKEGHLFRHPLYARNPDHSRNIALTSRRFHTVY